MFFAQRSFRGGSRSAARTESHFWLVIRVGILLSCEREVSREERSEDRVLVSAAEVRAGEVGMRREEVAVARKVRRLAIAGRRRATAEGMVQSTKIIEIATVVQIDEENILS